MGGPCRLRPAVPADAEAITALEQGIFSDPWSKGSIRETIGMPGMYAWLAVDLKERVRGYVFCREVAGEAELLNIAVDPELRRSGLGRELLSGAITWAEGRGAAEMYLEVRASNAGAIALYERYGFRAVGRRRDYYQHPVEDAVLYRRAGEGRA
jgi:ribosomal-protein-alanine N-acetyltransferase